MGMDDVTGGFGTYDLKEICQEYLEQAKDEEKDLTIRLQRYRDLILWQ